MDGNKLFEILMAEHAHKCAEPGRCHEQFGDSGVRRDKMDRLATGLLWGRLARHRPDLVNDAHLIYIKRALQWPVAFFNGKSSVDSGHVDGFVLTTMNNQAGWYRRHELRAEDGRHSEAVVHAEPTVAIIRAEEWQRLGAILANPNGLLNRTDQRLISLRLSGMSYQEIEEITEMKPSTAKVRVHRAIARLRDTIGVD